MKEKPFISTIIFDLGKVVVDFDFRKAFSRLLTIAPLKAAKVKSFLYSDAERMFTEGALTGGQFFEKFKLFTGIDIDFKTFCDIYNDIFTVNKDTERLIKQLKPTYRVCALSNTNELHMKFLMQEYPVMRLFELIITSFEEKCQKPDPLIFNKTMTKLGVSAHECIFIDDIEENVNAAKKIGFNAIHYQGHEKLMRDLAALGIQSGTSDNMD